MNIGAFTSTHTIRLYELCSQYKTVGRREIKLEDLKDWLQIKDKYPRYNSFNQRVLEPAVLEINAKSDLLYLLNRLNVVAQLQRYILR